MKRFLLVATAISIVLTGCGGADDGSMPTSSIPDIVSSTGAPTTQPLQPVTSEPMSLQSTAIERATADLSERLGVDVSAISVIEFRTVRWPDGALGCPREGEVYTQAIVEGGQVLLDFDGRIFDYRSDAAGNVELCPSEEKDGGYDFVPPPGFDEK